MSAQKVQEYFFFGVLIVSVCLTLLVFRPYLTLLAFSGVIAIIFHPLFKYIERVLKSPSMAAFLSVIAVAITVILPTVLVVAALYTELSEGVIDIHKLIDPNSLTTLLQVVLPPSMREQIPLLLSELIKTFDTIGSMVSSQLLLVFSNVISVLVSFFIILIAVYYLLKDGARMKRHLLTISPLNNEHDELIFRRMFVAVRAIMGGVIIIGAIKGLVVSVLFLIFGMPAPFFWGFVTGFTSLIPVVGAAAVLAPAFLYLLYQGHVAAAFALLVIAAFIIGIVDHFVQPKIVQSKTDIHPLLILLSILGGFSFYGLAGFVLGPLTLAVTMSLVDIYRKDFRNRSDASGI